MKNLAIRLIINGLALWVAASLIDGVHLVGGIMDVLIVALVFGAINALIKPVVKFLSVPFIFITLGLFTLVINAFMLLLAARLSPNLTVSGFWAAFFGALVVSVVSYLLSLFVSDDEEE